MSAIGPGDWVECIDASRTGGGPLFDGGFLVLGRIYQVDALSVATVDSGIQVPSVRLVGQPVRHAVSGRAGSYQLSRFKPCYRPKSDFIASLKHPAPSDRKKEEV